jgi:hypothetical protein
LLRIRAEKFDDRHTGADAMDARGRRFAIVSDGVDDIDLGDDRDL